MKKVSLLLIIGICTLFSSGIISRPSSSIAVFNTIEGNANSKDYSVEELVDNFFKDKKVIITKKSETEFYINDSNYYLSYVNGDITYTHKSLIKSNKTPYTNISIENSLETLNIKYDTNDSEGITRVQALEQVKSVVHKLGLKVDEEPYVFLSMEQKEDCYLILWNNRLNTTAYKTINNNSSKDKNYSDSNMGNTIYAVVTKDGIIDFEISKIYGAIQTTVQY